MRCYVKACLMFLCLTLQVQAKIMRNNALMSKMITHFQQDNNLSVDPLKEVEGGDEKKQSLELQADQSSAAQNQESDQQMPHQKTIKILNGMRKVLCQYFPTIPCNLIMQDGKLNKLIEQSILQLSKNKVNRWELPPQDTQAQGLFTRSTEFPVIDSEDLSNFLQVSNTGFFDQIAVKPPKSKPKTVKNVWNHLKPSNQKLQMKYNKDAKRGTEVFNGKKMRKFYPHKTKYKDKNDFKAYHDREDKVMLSMSAELPDMPLTLPQNSPSISYKMEQSDAPVWRIDYMKHGVPTLKQYFQGKLMQTASRGEEPVADGSTGTEQKSFYRSDVLHPDLYIKNKFKRKI